MSRLKQNLIVNVLGRGWSIVVSFLVVPVYIRLLGAEGFGLVAFFTSLVAALQFLEFGLGATINRELARASVDPREAQGARDLSRTLEVIYFTVAAVIGISIALLAGPISTSWLTANHLSEETVRRTVFEMGIAIGLLWPCSFYNNGLMGLEYQVLQSSINAAMNTLRAVGGVAVLMFVAASSEAFFLWQIVFCAVQLVVSAIAFWKKLPRSARRPRISLPRLRTVLPFTAGVGTTALLTFGLSQLDKIILSRLLPLAAFATYNVANQVNIASRMVPSALHAALFPRFSALLTAEGDTALRRPYHQSAQLLSLIVFPGALTGACFAYDIVNIWTGNSQIAANAAPIMAVLLLGSALNSVMGIPYDTTVAFGWTSFGLYQNLVSGIFFVPTMIVLAIHFGGLGAAYAWLLLNLGYLLISPPLIHRRILRGELRSWLFSDVLNALAAAAATALAARALIPEHASTPLRLLWVFMSWSAGSVACAFLLCHIRSYFLKQVVPRILVLARWDKQ